MIFLSGNTLIAKKSELYDIHGQYDLIIFHHSLEHMPDQARIMKKTAELIGQGGSIWCEFQLLHLPPGKSTGKIG